MVLSKGGRSGRINRALRTGGGSFSDSDCTRRDPPRSFRPGFPPGSALDGPDRPGYSPEVLSDHDLKLQQYLEGFLTEARKTRMRSVLAQRTRYVACVLEDLFDPRNGSAVIRHCDALGIQEIHAIENKHRFKSDAGVDMGTAQWLDLTVYPSDPSVPRTVKAQRRAAAASADGQAPAIPSRTPEVLDNLKNRGYRIIATSPHADDDATPESLDLSTGPVAVVFGTEKYGISEDVRSAADVFMRIPMVGFVESFNLSASAAIVFHVLSSRIRSENLDWQLEKEDAADIYLRWVKTATPHGRELIRKFEGEN